MTSTSGSRLLGRGGKDEVRIAFGGDYNPEQWPTDVWDEDVALMLEMGVDLATVGVFSWALLEPRPGEYHFEWLDDVLGRLTSAGIGIDLATATASPPAWLPAAHPEVLPVDADGVRAWPGGRQAFCPSSPVYRQHAQSLCRAMGERYGAMPGLRLWHVGNELGCHNSRCYCDVSAVAFRDWLRGRYGDIDSLNRAWGTAFWSQHYTDFDQVLPPRRVAAIPNPTQQLDFHRFSSAELLANFVAERDILREVSPGVPVTTNFMVMEHVRDMDYWSWSREVDVVSNDHYLIAADDQSHRELAWAADLTRGLAGGRPWLLMETSPGAVNWQPRNLARPPGGLLRSAMQHVARGADGILFFQWRASAAGAEKYHAGLLPHAGTDTRVWREAKATREALDAVAEVEGSVVRNRVAVLFDWEARWACELDARPSVDVSYLDQSRAWHGALTDAGVGVDFVHPEADLTGYDLLVVPTLYLVTDRTAEQLRAAVEAGATAVVTYFSGIVDEFDHVRLGGYPGAFRDLLGIRVEEFLPLAEGTSVRLSDGGSARVWTEDLVLAGARSVLDHVDGPAEGRPAVTRHEVGRGTAWYVATRLDDAGTSRLLGRILAESGTAPAAEVPAGMPAGVEVTRRTSADGARSWLFVVNHTDQPVTVRCRGHELVASTDVDNEVLVAAGSVAVVREG